MNLVPNPSFEEFDTCPEWGVNEICVAQPWFDAKQNCWGSSDYFHPCIEPSVFGGAPDNFAGFQNANSGYGYAGVGTFNVLKPDNSREYLEVLLIESLNPERNYCVSWQSSLGDYSRFGCNKIGAFFSTDTLYQTGSDWDYIPVIPHVEDLNINDDTLGWNMFHQSFVAVGGEQFMTIGNFRPGSDTDTSLNVMDPNNRYVYYYFDDFGVYLLPEIEAGTGGEICNFGQSVQLQASCTDCWDGLEYRWWPTDGLNDPDSLNTLATPNKTTTYYFGLIDPTETVPCIVDLVDSVTVTVCEGVVPTGFDFAIVPNPSSDQVKLVFSQQTTATTLKLYDARGRLIREEDIPANAISYVLNIEELSAGQYSIELRNPSSEARQKLVKM